MGLYDYWASVRDAVSPSFMLVIAIDVVALACDAGVIWSLVRPHARIPYARALLAQSTGYAINQLTPGNAVGEPIKIGMLAAHAPRGIATSAVMLYNLATIAVGVAVVVLGVPFALFALDLPRTLVLTIAIGAGAMVIAVGALVLWIRRGAFATAIALLRRGRAIGHDRALRWRDRARELDDQLRTFGTRSSRRPLAFAAASRALHVAGTLVLLRAVGISIATPLAPAIVSAGIAIGWAASVMPFGLGIADGGHYLLYAAVGASPGVGLVYAMLERARACAASVTAFAVAAAAKIALRGRAAQLGVSSGRGIRYA